MWDSFRRSGAEFSTHYFEQNGKVYLAFVLENHVAKVSEVGEIKENANICTDNWVYLSGYPRGLNHEETRQWLEVVWRTGAWKEYV